MQERIELQAEELAILLMAWTLLKRAYDALVAVECRDLGPPDLDRLAPRQLERFLVESGLSQRQQTRIEGSTRKSADYLATVGSVRLRTSQGVLIEYVNYVFLKGLSMEADFAAKFADASSNLQDALRHRRLAANSLDVEGQESDRAAASLRRVAASIADLGGAFRNRIMGPGPAS